MQSKKWHEDNDIETERLFLKNIGRGHFENLYANKFENWV